MNKESSEYYVKGYDHEGNYRMFLLNFTPKKRSEIKDVFGKILRTAWLFKVVEHSDPFKPLKVESTRAY